MKWATPYDYARQCTGQAEPGTRGLLAYFTETYDGHSGGIYNCRSVRGGSTTSTHAEGRSLDWMVPATPGKPTALGLSILAALGEHGPALGIQCVIYARRIYDARDPEGRHYGGVAPHWDHLHIEQTREAAASLRLADVRLILTPTVQEDDAMKTAIICKDQATNWIADHSTGKIVRISADSMAVARAAGQPFKEITNEAAMRNALALP